MIEQTLSIMLSRISSTEEVKDIAIYLHEFIEYVDIPDDIKIESVSEPLRNEIYDELLSYSQIHSFIKDVKIKSAYELEEDYKRKGLANPEFNFNSSVLLMNSLFGRSGANQRSFGEVLRQGTEDEHSINNYTGNEAQTDFGYFPVIFQFKSPQYKGYDDFLGKLIRRAGKIKLGSPMKPDTQMGPLSSLKQLEIIEKNIKLTVDQGGKIKCGGKRHSLSNKGYYFPATIIECENHNLPTAENELFGPVLSVMKFETEEEVINKMNDNQYGLSSGVYTKDLGRGLRVSKAIRAGITFVNTYRLISPSAPFGGMKDSGYGKEAGIESIKDYTRIKTTWFNTSEKPMEDPFTMG